MSNLIRDSVKILISTHFGESYRFKFVTSTFTSELKFDSLDNIDRGYSKNFASYIRASTILRKEPA